MPPATPDAKCDVDEDEAVVDWRRVCLFSCLEIGVALLRNARGAMCRVEESIVVTFCDGSNGLQDEGNEVKKER